MKLKQQFSIRTAVRADVSALEQLIEQSVRQLQRMDYTSDQIEGALGFAFGVDTQLLADRTYFVAEPATAAGLVVGCGGWSYRRTLFGSDHGPNRETALLDPASDSAKIRAIFVHPDWERRGLGTLILRHCEDAAREAGFHHLEMGSTLTGVPLYRRHGYIGREHISIPLPNGSSLPILRMTRDLEPADADAQQTHGSPG